jgi:hypothetical protein
VLARLYRLQRYSRTHLRITRRLDNRVNIEIEHHLRIFSRDWLIMANGIGGLRLAISNYYVVPLVPGQLERSYYTLYVNVGDYSCAHATH